MRRWVAAAAGSALGTVAAARALAPLSGSPRLLRTNHRGGQVSLVEGPAVVIGAVAGTLAGTLGRAPDRRRRATAAALAVGGAGAAGLLDDLAEGQDRGTKGLRGHLGALAAGRLTTGGVKVLAIGATAVAAAAMVTPRPQPPARWAADVLCSGALIAASANLVNLLDLRPGRAVKATVLAAAMLPGVPEAGAAMGSAVAAMPADLAETTMLGDTGANALGAALGLAAVQRLPRPARWGLLCALVAATVASERVSFTRVIESTPVLREVDAWGRLA